MISLSKFKVLCRAIKGYLYKWLVDLGIISVPDLKNNACDMIVSLTSYGRRVSEGVVYYTLVSLLRQNMQPSKIILWLSESEWNDMTLPKKLKALRSKGIEIRYCKDMRSYKKLIPTLALEPERNVMTVDDDIIYTKDTIKVIWEEHKKFPNAIVCLNASTPLIVDGIPYNYAKWDGIEFSINGMMIFPVGCGGTFYPLGSLHNDVMSEDLFMKLCPLADDIWFWFCGLLTETEKVFVKKSSSDLSFDALYQYFHQGSALTHTNRFEHANDKQFKDLFEYYRVVINDRGELVAKE